MLPLVECCLNMSGSVVGVVAAFTLPKVYEVNKSQIDQYVDVGQAKFDDYYQL